VSASSDPRGTAFDTVADAYEAGRPGYPREAADFLLDRLQLGRGSLVLDLGAGTGKFTRLLAGGEATVFAAEPLEAMRAMLKVKVPEVAAVAARAEALPFRAAALDAVFVADAFHWFPFSLALAEIHRVLRPGGALALLFNWPDESDRDWAQRLRDLVEKHREGAPSFLAMEWREAIEGAAGFTDLQEHVVSWTPRSTVDSLVERIRSISFIAALPDDRQKDMLEEARDLLRTHPDTRDKDEIAVPYKTHLFWCFKDDSLAG
jgi:ubiquinone/menaquinone biosynthesis C-methylase UbiE